MTTLELGTNIWPADLAQLSIDGPSKLTDDIRASEAFAAIAVAPEGADIAVQYFYDEDFGEVESSVFIGEGDRWALCDSEDGYDTRHTSTAAQLAIIMFRDRRDGMVWLSSKFTGPSTAEQLTSAPRGSIAVAVGLTSHNILVEVNGAWVNVHEGIDSETTTDKLLSYYPGKVQLIWTAPAED